MYVQADGNYVTLHFRDSSTKVLTMQLNEFEKLLKRKAVRKFSRVGRSLIVNNQYVFSINLTKQEIVISDKIMFTCNLTASKGALEDLKNNIEKNKK
jgi:DNA-binding LytR/AlgR family response regulator